MKINDRIKDPKKQMRYELKQAIDLGLSISYKHLMDLGVDFKTRYMGESFLYYAISNKRHEMIKDMIQRGVDLNFTTEEPDKIGRVHRLKFCYLSLAAKKNDQMIFDLLADNGARFQDKQYAAQSIINCIHNENKEMAKRMIQFGANPFEIAGMFRYADRNNHVKMFNASPFEIAFLQGNADFLRITLDGQTESLLASNAVQRMVGYESTQECISILNAWVMSLTVKAAEASGKSKRRGI